MTEAALGITHSISGQPWHWRRTSAEMGGESLAPDDLVTQLLMARGVPRVDIERQRTPTLRGFMPDPSLFRDMDAAAARLADAVEAREAVTIFGDYDVDGATSAALLVRLLRALDVPVGAYIPDRLMEGYGPSGAALVRIGEAASKLIVTVDCGAQAFDAIAEARAAGVAKRKMCGDDDGKWMGKTAQFVGIKQIIADVISNLRHRFRPLNSCLRRSSPSRIRDFTVPRGKPVI